MSTKRNKYAFLEIDTESLDSEWEMQPELVFKHGQRLAEAEEEVERAKAELEEEKARLDSQIREDPESYGIIKLTETQVTNTILLQPSYKDALDTYFTARNDYLVCRSVTTALDHKRSALENLVKLYGMNYFSSPRAELKDEIAAKEKKRRV